MDISVRENCPIHINRIHIMARKSSGVLEERLETDKAFLAMGFSQWFLSHLSPETEITAADQHLFPLPAERDKKEPEVGQFKLQNDPRKRNSV